MKDIQSGDILFYSETGFIGNIINYFTNKNKNKQYTHCEIAIDSEKSYEIRPTGIKILNFKNIKKNVKYIDIYRIRKTTQIVFLLEISKIIFENIKTYSIFNLFVFIFIKFCRKINLKWFEGNKTMICSEFVGKVLLHMKLQKNDVLPSLLSPNDIPENYYIFFVKRIYLDE